MAPYIECSSDFNVHFSHKRHRALHFTIYIQVCYHTYTIYAIIIEHFLRRWRLGHLNHGIKGWRQHFRPKVCKANIFGLLLWRFKIVRVIYENAYWMKYRTHKIWFLWVLYFQCWYAFSYNFVYIIIMVKFLTYLPYIYLV